MDRTDAFGAEGADLDGYLLAPRPLSAERADLFHVDGADGAAIACYVWREAPADAPALIWGHANGFNAGSYAPVLRRLAGHFQVFAFDARGHGASPAPAGEPAAMFTMDRLAADLARIVAAVRARIGPDRPLHYASHSMCGNAAILLEVRLGEAPFRSLTLFEPPIHPPADHPEHGIAVRSSAALTRWAAKRRERFPDRATLRQEVQAIATFTRFTPEMLDAYVDAAAYQTDAGDWALYCRGAVESAFYDFCPQAGMFAATAGVGTSTWLFSSDPAGTDRGHAWAPATLRDAVAAMPNARYGVIAGCGHLMVQEDPDACVAQVLAHTDSVD